MKSFSRIMGLDASERPQCTFVRVQAKEAGACFHVEYTPEDGIEVFMGGGDNYWKVTDEVRAPEIIPPSTDEYIELHLTRAEAETLLFVGRRIAGSPEHTARGYMDSIVNALRQAKVLVPARDASGEIRFEN